VGKKLCFLPNIERDGDSETSKDSQTDEKIAPPANPALHCHKRRGNPGIEMRKVIPQTQGLKLRLSRTPKA